MPTKRVLSLGQCHADHSAISRTIARHFGADVLPTSTPAEALTLLRQERFDLVLVNRVGDADGSSGLEFIKQMKADDVCRNVPVMLVSNYEDSQREAVEVGAVPGFGKAALGQPLMLDRLRTYLM
jgi:two-component system chemotaxis response regulator CheY